jgi:hypothetical protein
MDIELRIHKIETCPRLKLGEGSNLYQRRKMSIGSCCTTVETVETEPAEDASIGPTEIEPFSR